jgi:outer membrane protein assembly factor BamB
VTVHVTVPARTAAWVRGALVAAIAAAGCTSLTARRPPPEPRAISAGVLELRWRDPLNRRDLFDQNAEECATGAVAGTRLVIGTRGGRVYGVERSNGRVLWTMNASGGVDSHASYDARRNQVYVGTDDGTLLALDPSSGAVRWRFQAQGAVDQPAEMDEHAVYVTTTADHVYALDPASGRQLWQYEREPPEGFTIHGNAGVRLAGNVLYTGFTDGYLVALRTDSGELLWARSLAGASEQFVDVDTTPALFRGLVIAASYSGGIVAVDAKDGAPKWRFDVDGAGTPVVVDDADGARLYFAAPRAGVHALDAGSGTLEWRQALADAGDLSNPIVSGSYLVFSGSRAGTFVVDRHDGQLLQLFDRSSAALWAPSVDGCRLALVGRLDPGQRRESPDELFDPAAAARVAGPPLEPEAELFARAADPGHAARERHRDRRTRG